MAYQVIIPKKVQKQLDKIDSKYKVRILAVLVSLEDNPYLGKKLAGKYKSQWSYNVWPYRIIYEIEKKKLIILIVRIGHRQGSYKRK
jgi:mRNA interferase RelE/StbE